MTDEILRSAPPPARVSGELPVTGEKQQSETRPATTLLKGEFVALEERKIMAEVCMLYGYSVGSHRGMRAEISGYRNSDNVVVAQHVRLGDKAKFQWVNRVDGLQLFGAHLGSTGRLILTEGQIDAMSCYQALDVAGRLFEGKMPTTVASITDGAGGGIKSIEANIRWILGFDEVTLFFDLDGPGQEAAIKASAIIGPRTRIVTRFPYKDASEALQKDDGAAISAAIQAATIHRPNYIQPATTLLEEILKPKDRTGILLPWESWNGLLGNTPRTMGMRPGEVWCLTGGTGLGKSVFGRAIATHVAERGTKVAFIPLEETCERTYELMLSACLGYRIDMLTPEQRLGRAEQITNQSRTIDSITFVNQFGGSDFDSFVATIKHLVLAEGCRIVILDHFSMLADGIDIGIDQRRSIDRCMKRIKELTVELGFTMVMLAHLSRQEGKSHEEGARPQLRDLRGSHSIAQVSDLVIALQRNPHAADPNSTTCWMLKNRPFGQVGPMGKLLYEQATGRLIDQPFSFDSFTDDE
jgi:twinkle protein